MSLPTGWTWPTEDALGLGAWHLARGYSVHLLHHKDGTSTVLVLPPPRITAVMRWDEFIPTSRVFHYGKLVRPGVHYAF